MPGKVEIHQHLLHRAQHSTLGDHSVPAAITKHVIDSESGETVKWNAPTQSRLEKPASQVSVKVLESGACRKESEKGPTPFIES